MKKSFRKVVAILLAVMMIVCSFPLTALAEEETRTNINLQFGDVTNSTAAKHYTSGRGASSSTFKTYTGLNSTKLEYSNGKITGYGVGDYFAVSVLVENVSQIAAAETAIKYSDSIVPAYIKNASSGTLVGEYTEAEAAIEDSPKLGAFLPQSGNALYNTTSTIGETSYIDADTKTMHAQYSVQTGADYASATTVKGVADNTFVLATFLFKIVSNDAITFSIDTTDDNYYLATTENGGKTEEYKTYVPKSENEKAELDFMGKNEYNGSEVNKYTIKFVDADGHEISSAEYEEGAEVTIPELPAMTYDDAQHYTYAWNEQPEATATKDATYTIVKTGEAHTWDEGTVTTDPTTTTPGVKTFKCTVDGCGATKTESIDPITEEHVHTWSEWTYNNDATYTSSSVHTDGTATRHCTGKLADGSDCTETETKTIAGTGTLRANTASVTLGAAVVMNVGIDKTRTSSFKSSYIRFEYAGQYYDVKDLSDRTTSTRWFYDFDKISPDKFGETVQITPYGVTEDGIVCRGLSVETSIKKYAYQTLGKSATKDTLKTLLVEMLYYGAEYQNYMNYKTDELVTADLTDEQKARHTTDVPEYTKLTNPKYSINPNGEDNNQVILKSASLLLEGKVIPQVKIEIPKTVNINDITFTWTVNGKVTPFTYEEHPDWFVKTTASTSTASVNDAYFIQCTILQANQFSIPLYFTAYNGSVDSANQVSNVLQYSVESYATGSVVKNNAKLKALVDQILRYGRADVTYMGGTDTL